jgi:probable rRNA maturation factor
MEASLKILSSFVLPLCGRMEIIMTICIDKRSALPRHRIGFADKTDNFTDPAFIRAAKKGIRSALSYQGVGCACETELCFVDEDEIKSLNSHFRDNESVTDVLSFPVLDIKKGENPEEAAGRFDYVNGRVFLGSIVICKPVAISQAESYGHSAVREFAFLAVHSVLHLLGYDHVTGKKDEDEMFGLQEKILLSAGFARK